MSALTLHSTGEGVQCLSLDGALNIYEAQALWPQWLQALQGVHTLELDFSLVGEIDTAGVQLLLLLAREAERLGCHVQWVQASDTVREVLEFCRLQNLFSKPVLTA